MGITLHQFEFSHFNDKVRWALDFKGIEHQRKSYLPGPHMPKMKKLSGQAQTPVVSLEGRVIAGSAQIIDALELRFPTPSLYPVDEVLRKQALALQSRFDEVVGPATRTALFSELIHELGYIAKMFGNSASRPSQLIYRGVLPVVKGIMAKGNGVTDPDNVTQAFEILQQTLDEVADVTQNTGYMVGDRFSIADLTTAALLAPFANPDHVDMRRPVPMPQSISELLAKYNDHPAIHWVGRMYAEHRPEIVSA